MDQLSREEREKQLKKIEDLFQKAKEYTDNKVQIAVQIYEMVSGNFVYILNFMNSPTIRIQRIHITHAHTQPNYIWNS